MLRIALLAFLLHSAMGHTDASINITEKSQQITYGVKYFIDKSAVLTYGDIKVHKDWQTIQKNNINFGYVISPIWVKFHSKSNLSGDWILYLNYPLLDYLDVYILKEGKLVQEFHTGDLLPFDSRPMSHENFAFPFKLEKDKNYEFYLRVQTEGASEIPIFLESLDKYHNRLATFEFIRGWVNGICIIMLIYNFFVYLFVREKIYIYYIINVAAFVGLLSVYDGSAYQYFWPDKPEVNIYAFPIIMGILQITQFLFIIVFLDLLNHRRWYVLPVRIFLYSLFTLPFLIIFFDYKTTLPIQVIFALSVNIIGLIFGYYFIFRGKRSAYIFSIAWTLFLIGLMITNIKGFGLVPSNIFTNYSYHFSAFFELTLLSIALAQRIEESKQSIINLKNKNIETLGEYQNLYNNSLSGQFKSDMIGRFISTNPAFDKMFNPNNKWNKIQDHTVHELLLNSEDAKYIEPTLLDRKPIIDYEIQLKNNEGEVHWYSLSVRPNSSKKEKHTHFEGSIIDINERKENEALKERSLQDRMTTLEQLSIGISHEINTPLGISITASSLIKNLIDEIDLSTNNNSLTKNQLISKINQGKESVQLINNGLNRVSELIKQLKMVSVNLHGFSITQEVVGICIRNAYQAIKSSYKVSKLTIICDHDIQLKTYTKALELVIQELIENSHVHSFEKINNGEIKISTIEKDENVIIDYTDNGVGIDIENQSELFNAFFTTKRGSHGRVGLGMYQVYNLVSQLLKGKIELIPGPHIHYQITLPKNIESVINQKSPH